MYFWPCDPAKRVSVVSPRLYPHDVSMRMSIISVKVLVLVVVGLSTAHILEMLFCSESEKVDHSVSLEPYFWAYPGRICHCPQLLCDVLFEATYYKDEA